MSVPNPPPEDLVVFMRRCSPRERRFIDLVLRGEPHEIAAQTVGYRSRLAAADLLGRPQVAAAIQRAAPYLPPDIAVRALRPLLVNALTRTALGKGSAGISAVRDLIALGKAGQESPAALDEWAKRQAARALARKAEKLEPIGPTSTAEVVQDVNVRDPLDVQ